MAKSKDEAPSLAEQLQSLLTKATATDVEEIDAAIAQKEAEIASLRQTRKLLAVAAGVEEPAKKIWSRKKKEPATNGKLAPAPAAPATSYQPTSDMHTKRRRVLLHLRANGNTEINKLSEKTGVSRFGPGALKEVLAHEWFHQSPEGIVSLTDKGDRAVI